MPPDTQHTPASTGSAKKEKDGTGHGHHKERIGNYVVGAEIGRGSFATVYKGYRSVSSLPYRSMGIAAEGRSCTQLGDVTMC